MESEKKWYVIHTYSGYENKVKANLESRVHTMGMEDNIFNVIVPMEEEAEIKDGKKKLVKKKVFPGYALVEMIVNDRSWYVVRNTTGVTGFVGSEKHPIPLTAEEAERILSGSVGGAPKRRAKVDVGDTVRIISGAFEDYAGKITSIDTSSMRVQVDVDGTPLDVEIDQVERI